MEVKHMSSNAKLFTLSESERRDLEALAHHPTTDHRLASRASIVLAAEGRDFMAAAEELGCTWRTIAKWCRRYLQSGVSGLGDKPRSGRAPQISAEVKARIISIPAGDHSMNSCRKVAAATGVSRSTVSRIWRHNGIKPHLASQRDKAASVRGLQLLPRATLRGEVLGCDQALSHASREGDRPVPRQEDTETAA